MKNYWQVWRTARKRAAIEEMAALSSGLIGLRSMKKLPSNNGFPNGQIDTFIF
jgi:hypothetical protein